MQEINEIQAILLGIIQGVTEFIPISSSAHLIMMRWFAGWENHSLAFDVALHVGSLFAVFVFFGKEWYGLIKEHVAANRFSKMVADGEIAAPVTSQAPMLLWPIAIATIPAGIAGMTLNEVTEDIFRTQPYLVGSTLIGLGLLLYFADRVGRKNRPMHKVTTKDWLIIGIAQALAIVPGVSRSGITITAGLLCGLQRESAARFSFLLGAPIILGAGVYEMKDILRYGIDGVGTQALVLGMLASAVVGYLCIKFLIDYMKKRGVGIFVAYRVLIGLAVIVSHAAGRITV